LEWIAAQNFSIPVVYVAGNHDFYCTNYELALADAEHWCRDYNTKNSKPIYFLHDAQVIIDKTAFIGATLWTDYKLYGEGQVYSCMDSANRGMNDHRLIRAGMKGVFSPDHARQAHNKSRKFIEISLEAIGDALQKVVITHHAPSQKSIAPRYATSGGQLNAAFASNLDNLASLADVWLHGHMHNNSDYFLGDCRVVCNPSGYPGENCGFDPELVLAL
jgi:DNA repair exonuclease SbcCD nuclease subunit